MVSWRFVPKFVPKSGSRRADSKPAPAQETRSQWLTDRPRLVVAESAPQLVIADVRPELVNQVAVVLA